MGNQGSAAIAIAVIAVGVLAAEHCSWRTALEAWTKSQRATRLISGRDSTPSRLDTPRSLFGIAMLADPTPSSSPGPRPEASPGSIAPAPTNGTNGTAFRATLLPLLRSLPSAAAHTGFASLHSAARGERVFARGLCFGNSTVPSQCARCLSAAAGNLTAGCGATSRRAGIWSDRCFLSYADTNTSSPSEDAFRARVRVLLPGDDAVPRSAASTKSFYYAHLHDVLVAMAKDVARRAAANISRPRMLATAEETNSDSAVSRTVHVLAQCGRDRTAADCVRCLQDSVQAVDWDLHAAHSDGGVAAAVMGFDCYLRFEVSTAVGDNYGSNCEFS
ncbi:unnamed protein product [Triticum turgidum subsp. durum]|uniref:Gnk2-homologous domain-containing protein n=1 Tax=Triticum turgidum subsp. durum TaxID=4567 RepID=A0A9R1QDL5_TRITD|nr:unnamed protein product [Triticum turgidum subsp. durum]